MPTVTPLTMYITVRTEEVNGKQAAHSGKLLIHLENYREISDTLPPPPKDTSLQQFIILVDPDDVQIQMDGALRKVYLWRGPKQSRHLQTLVSVPILPLNTAFGSVAQSPAAIAATTRPVELVREAFNEFPEPVRLAGLIAATDPALLSTLPTGPGQLKAWADQQLQTYEEQMKAAGAAG